MSRNDNHLCGLTLYAETCSLATGHAGPCADGTSERPALLRDRDALAARVEALESTMREIAKGEGRFSRDHMQHAINTIEDMKALALAALASPSGGGACG